MFTQIFSSRPRTAVLSGITGLCIALFLPAVTWGITPCPTHNSLYPPGQQPGDEIFKGAVASFVASGKEAGVRNFYYKLSFDVRSDLRNVSPGNSFVFVYGADAEGNGGSAFLSCSFQEFQTHYETDGTHCGQYASIPESDVSGSTVTITPLYGFGSDVCRGPTFEIPAGIVRNSQADEVCDGLDNDEDNQVDDVAGGCNAQAVAGLGDDACTSLECAWHKLDKCPSSPNGGPTPCAGGSFDTRFGFEERRLPLIEVSSPGIPLRLDLVYNNRHEGASSLSGRWFTSLDVGLSVRVEGALTVVIVRWPDGTRSRYSTSGGTDFFGEFSDGSRVKQTYTTKTESWDLFYRDGLRYHFTASGLLDSIHDNKGNTITVARENSAFPSLPTRVTDNYGHELLLAYGTSGEALGKLTTITDPAGRSYDFAYQDFILKTVTLPAPETGRPRPSYELFYADLTGFDRGGYRDNLTQIQFHPDAGNPDPVNDRVVGKWNYDNASRVEEEERAGGILGRTVTYGTDQTTVTDSRGNDAVYGFDFTSGLTLTTTVPCESCPPPNSATSTLIRNAQGKITSHTDFRGYQTTWANHDSNGDPRTISEAVGEPEERTTTFDYHPKLHLPLLIIRTSTITTTEHKVTIFDYEDPATAPADPPLHPTQELDPADYNATANLTNLVQRVIESGWTRDVSGNPVRVAYVTHFTYDGLGRVTNIDGPRSSTPNDDTDFAYYADSGGQGNKQGQLHTVTNALGQTTTFNDYDAMGNLLSVTDPNGLVTTFTYDAANRVRTITQVGAGKNGSGQAINLVTTYVYEANGNLDYIQLPRGNFYNYQYDAANRLTSITRTFTQPTSPTDTPAGETIRYFYDTEGNRIREEVAPTVGGQEVRLTEFAYDALNRLQRVYNPLYGQLPSATVYRESTIDANGNRTALDLFKDFGATQLRHTDFTFDPLNRLKQVTQDGGSLGNILTAYGYDGQDNLATLTDARDHDTNYLTDDFGRQVEVISPDTGTTRYEYDEAGNLLEKDQNGLVTDYAYDALNRLTAVTFPSDTSQNITYTYDDRSDGPTLPPADGDNWVGRLAKMEDGSGTTYLSYDKRGNVVLEERHQGAATLTTTYAWDENGNLTTLTYPSGRQVNYSYYGAANDRPILVGMAYQGQNQALATNITFEPFGPLAFLRYGNGLKETRTYDDAGQIDTLTVAPDTGTAVLSLDYTFDETGNVREIADNLDSQKTKSYAAGGQEGYDRLDRLIDATIGGLGRFQYTYDAVGNRTEEDHDGAVTTYHIKSTNNQIDTLSGATTATFQYDDHGNTETDGTLTFRYYPSHQLKEVQDAGMTVLGTYQYDGQSRRTAKTVNGLTRLFAYDTGAQLIGEYDAAGNVLKEYAYLGTQRLAMVDHDRDDDTVRDETDNCTAVQNPGQADADADLLGDACDSAPNNPDRDGDGLLDGQEDADRDGVVGATETDPDNPDTDGDTFSDGDEVAQGTDPLNPNSYPGAPSAVPALSGPGVGLGFVVGLGVLWFVRKRYPRGGTIAGFVLLGVGVSLVVPDTVTSQGGGTPERVYYIHTDHLGTPLKLTDGSQTVVWEGQAEPFGGTTGVVQEVVFNLRFRGQYDDRETGLFHNGLRTYHDDLGAYIEPDPVGLIGGVNLYHYAHVNPAIFIDPLGLLTWAEVGEIFWNNLRDAPRGMYEQARQDAVDLFWWPSRHPEETLLLVLGGEALAGEGPLCSAEVTRGVPASRSLIPRNFETIAPGGGRLGGFSATETLRPGTLVDRFGPNAGRFVSPAGTPFSARGLPPEAASERFQTFEVLQELEVEASIASPAYGGGLGVQYRLPASVQELIDAGILGVK